MQRAHEQMYRRGAARSLAEPQQGPRGLAPFCRSRAAFKLKQLDEQYKLFNRRGGHEEREAEE